MLSEWLAHFISHYGYLALFVIFSSGILGWWIPDELVLAYCGFLAQKEEMNLTATLAVTLASCWIGITLSYYLGRWLGLPLALRYGRYARLNEDRLMWAHGWFERRGRWILVITYFVPGLRHLTALIAGVAKVDLPIFGLCSYSAATVWTVTFLGAGYTLGGRYEQIARNRLVVPAVVAAAIGVGLTGSILIRRAMRIAARGGPALRADKTKAP